MLYVHLIRKARRQDRRKGDGTYYESHHILPKTMGGPNTKANLILFTAEEHLRAHLLLPEMVEGKSNKHKMACALHLMMVGHSGHQRVGAPQFCLIARAKMSAAKKRDNLSEETRAKLSAAAKRKRKPHSEERKANISASLRRTETRAKLSAAKKGNTNRKGKNNASFKGWYITPWGKFDSAREAEKAIDRLITYSTIRIICKASDKIITNVTFRANRYLKTRHDKTVVGLKWSDLGFGYEPKDNRF